VEKMELSEIIAAVADFGVLGVLIWILRHELSRVDRLIEYNLRMTETCFGQHLDKMREQD
jgi:hypothetical protein